MSDINPDFLAGLAQLETAGGVKTAGANNLYNVKDFSGKGTRAFDKAEGSNDAYRDYASPAESTADLIGLLGRKYPKALEAKTGAEFAQALKDGGYATDPNYVAKLTAVIAGGKFGVDVKSHFGAAQSSRVGPDGVAVGVTDVRNWDAPTLDTNLPRGKQQKPDKAEPITDVGLKTSPVRDTAAEDAAATTAAQAAQQATDNLGIVDIAQKKFMPNTLVGAALRKTIMDDFVSDHKPVSGYVPDPKEFAGYTADEQAFIATAGNPVHLAFIKSDIDQVRDLRKEGDSKGLGYSLVGDLVAGFPEGFGEGVIATRGLQLAKLGSLQLAAQGRTGAAIASSAAENAGANLLATAVQDSIDPYVETDNYAMGTFMGLGISALHVPGIMKSARTGGILRAFQQGEAAAAEKMAARREQAVKNVGAEATPETLQAEVQRLETEEIRRETSVHTAEVASDRRLLPEDENLRVDTPEATAAPEKAVPEAPAAKAETPEPISTEKLGELPAGKRQAAVDADVRAQDQAREWTQRGEYTENELFSRYQLEGKALVAEHMEGVPNLGWAERQGPGVHILPEFKRLAESRLRPVADAVEVLAQRFLPNATITLGAARFADGASGSVLSAGRGVHLIAISPAASSREALATAAHEISHAVIHEKLRDASPELIKRLLDEHKAFREHLSAGRDAQAKFARLNENSPNLVTKEGKLTETPLPSKENGTGSQGWKDYAVDFDEWLAEGGTRFIQRDARGANQIGLTTNVINMMRDAWNAVKELFGVAKSKGWLPKDEAVDEFFQRALDGTLKQAEALPEHFDSGIRLPELGAQASRTLPQNRADFATDAFNIANGLHLMPTKTVTEAAEAKAVQSLYKKATENGYKTDEKRLSWLMNTSLFQGAQGVANTMLRSKNPVVRMIASELVESAGGAGGRKSTAAIGKHLNEQAYLGNTLNEVQGHYDQFRKGQGVLPTEDIFGGKTWAQFNRLVAEEIESRRPGASPVETPTTVKAAADALEKSYERIRGAQTAAKTIGWASLPENSKGYMPHRLNKEKLANATQAQVDVLHSVLLDQFQAIEGFDPSFSANLASKYIDRVRSSALGGFSPPMGIHQVGAADVVEDALRQMGLDREQITKMMQRYMAGGAGHTKRRLQLDLTKTYPAGADGETFKLMDLFETDQFKLLRTQAQRVSGEVALAGHGVMGMPGLKLLRRAMEFGGDGQRATRQEAQAFDQIAAELLGTPFGSQSKMVDRALQANSLARLGGMGFTQFAESINGVWHVGAMRTLSAIGDIGRLRSEIKALARGETVNNPIIGSFEQYRGAEFGTEAYKTVFPFDNGTREVENFGADTLTAADRLLRGAAHLQGKLSFWRTVHSTQQRGFAEQIVRKAAQYLKDGSNDVALRDMGFDDNLMGRLRKDLDNIATFDPNGRLTDFDITKASDKKAAEEMTQAIHRGVGQIIQNAFIGERGAWAHDGVMRLMTQFRTFGLTSVEKQWARQTGNVGTAKAFGMLIGSLSMAAPVYMARTYLASIGRKDQAEYLEKQLAWGRVARASLNYVSASGLAGDFLDATSSITGLGQSTGGRAGQGSDFVGNVVAPAAGLANDVYKGIQNTKEGTDPHQLIKALPFSRHPLLIPAINALD